MFRRANARKVCCVPCGESRTEAHWQKTADINNIIARALGGDASVYRHGAVNADVSNMPDNLQDALNQQIEAASLYDALTDDAKRYFGTPEGLLKAIMNPNESENLVKFGLAEVPTEPEAVKVEVVNQQTTPEGAQTT